MNQGEAGATSPEQALEEVFARYSPGPRRHVASEGETVGKCPGHDWRFDDEQDELADVRPRRYLQPRYLQFYSRWVYVSFMLFACGVLSACAGIVIVLQHALPGSVGAFVERVQGKVPGGLSFVLYPCATALLIWLSYWVGDADGAERGAREISNERFIVQNRHFYAVYAITTNLASVATTPNPAGALLDDLGRMSTILSDMLESVDEAGQDCGNPFLLRTVERTRKREMQPLYRMLREGHLGQGGEIPDMGL